MPSHGRMNRKVREAVQAERSRLQKGTTIMNFPIRPILNFIDLDGTLTDNRHRTHLRESDPAAYLKARVDDTASPLSFEYQETVDALLKKETHIVGAPFSHHRILMTDRPMCAARETFKLLNERGISDRIRFDSYSFRTSVKPSPDDKLARILALTTHLMSQRTQPWLVAVVVVDDRLEALDAVQIAAKKGLFGVQHVACIHVQQDFTLKLASYMHYITPDDQHCFQDPLWT